jgi:hypothetical protein
MVSARPRTLSSTIFLKMKNKLEYVNLDSVIVFITEEYLFKQFSDNDPLFVLRAHTH